MIGNNGSIITNAGYDLIYDSQSRGIPIEFTTMKVGSGRIDNVDPESLIDLITIFREIGINSLKRDGNSLKIKGALTNEGVTDSIEIREVGVYAKTAFKGEVLYCYSNSGNGDILQPEVTGTSSKEFTFQTTMSNAHDATYEIAQGVYALASDLSETEERLKAEVEASTGGRNTVLFDDMRKPSIMVKIPRFFLSDVMDDVVVGSVEDKIHPAFIVNGEVKNEILISKYQNVIVGERAYSLPSLDPKISINYDQAHDACNKKGEGWHLMTNAEWAALALYSLKNETEPLGNNYCGVDNANKLMSAIESYTWKLSYDWNNRSYKEEPIGTFWHTGRTKTGSGPDKFSHDHTNSGVFDLNGNVHEWVGGLRLRNGEIQVIKDNDAAKTNADHSDGSPLWMGITDGNNYTMPGSARTLKLDNTAEGSDGETSAKIGGSLVFNIARDFPHFTGGEVNEYYGYNYNSLKNVAFKEGVIKPRLFEELCICSPGNQGEDRLYARNYGERLPIRGGNWSYSSTAGVFTLNLSRHRLYSDNSIGFRSAFVS